MTIMSISPGRWKWYEVLLAVSALMFFFFIVIPLLLSGGIGTEKQSARRAVCLSNMKQIGTAIAIYSQDNNERLPVTNAELGAIGWLERTAQYVGNEELFLCPVDGSNHSSETKLDKANRLSYAMNMNLASLGWFSSSSAPGQTVMLFEAESIIAEIPNINQKQDNNPSSLSMHQSIEYYSPAGSGVKNDLFGGIPNTNSLVYATGPMSNSRQDQYEPRHQGKANFLFLDTSARSLIPNVVSAGRSALKVGNPESPNGCAGLPCAESLETKTHRPTFSHD